MVAHNTSSHGEPPRSLSAEVETQLARALAALAGAKRTEPDGALKLALEAAAHEARERGLMPEELILAFKNLEQRLTPRGDNNEETRVALRTKIIRALLEAYYTR